MMPGKFFFMFLTALILPALVMAQAGFELEPLDELEATVDVGVTHGFHNTLTNTGDAEDIIRIMLRDEDVPDDWQTMMCIGSLCYAPFIREIPDTMSVGVTDTIIIDFVVESEGTGTLWLYIQSTNDTTLIDSLFFTVHGVISNIAGSRMTVPSEFSLSPVYPNPFNSTARISFTLPSAGMARVSIVTPAGREVTTLMHGEVAAGQHQIGFRVKPDMSSGLYLVKLEASGRVAMQKALFIK